MARMSNKLTGRDFSTSSSAPTSSIQHTVNHSTLISGDTREVDYLLNCKFRSWLSKLDRMKICAKIMSGMMLLYFLCFFLFYMHLKNYFI